MMIRRKNDVRVRPVENAQDGEGFGADGDDYEYFGIKEGYVNA